jgi:hypothetical protein
MTPGFVVVLGSIMLAAAVSAGTSYPDGTEGLKALVTHLGTVDDARAEALAEGLALEDAEGWFKKHFGAAEAAALAEEYVVKNRASALTMALYARNQRGQSDLVVERFDDAADPNAVGYQELALQAARAPLVLYSVRAVSSDKKKITRWHLYNFVYLQDAWKLVGPMKALATAKRDPAGEMRADLRLDTALSLRTKERDAFLKKNKLPR